MSMTLYSHSFSSYRQKVLIALWENEIPFTYRHLEERVRQKNVRRSAVRSLSRRRWTMAARSRGPASSSSIWICTTPVVRLLPDDRGAVLQVRFMDRFFEQLCHDGHAKAGVRGATCGGRAEGRGDGGSVPALDTAYAWLEERLSGRTWRRARASPWPIAPPRRRSSMPIGFTRSGPTSHDCGNIVRACWRGRPSRALLMRHDPIGLTFRLVRPIATNERRSRAGGG